MADQLSRRQIQLGRHRTQGTRAEKRMKLLAENGLSDIAVEPGIDHMGQSHLLHTAYDAGEGAVAADQIIHGTADFVA
jgi:hypothetical protein